VDSGELVGVGAFAQLSGLTVETLRHYHQVGLLAPAEVDDRTGFRRYGLGQLPRARALAALRDVGMPLGIGPGRRASPITGAGRVSQASTG
jgi:MerR family regulatory protein